MRYIYIGLGFFFFGLAVVGAALPILPTVPFLLLSSFCFAKGSDKFHRWFCSTKLYQKHLDSFARDRSMTVRTKATILIWASSMLLLAFFLMENIYGRAVILLVMAAKYYYFFFRIKTIKPEKSITTGNYNEENING